ncbi:MAG: hypothetical protein JKX85_05000 [Phycisphaeraceae bacterium]|nr:hypothetical protein [Phycisphaeraceae bacterium]
MKTILSLAPVCFLLLSTSIVSAGIVGSAHDFAATDWSAGEICLPCHTPHNASTTATSAPLWNHLETTATFTMYNSATLQVATETEPRGPSKLCLSCHDGTVALDSFSNMTGTNFISGAFNLGTDLSNDHPISIKWQHQTEIPPGCGDCHFSSNPTVPFPNGFLECTTCHDVHNQTTFPSLLRLSMQGSELCLHCHYK